MARILTGIQSTGVPHFGNILGAIQPLIELSNQQENEAFAFVADLHSLTTIRNAAERVENIKAVVATWIACGFDYKKNTLYLQSDVTEVTELTWYLSCFTPYPMLANAHSFKDKGGRMSEVNAGLFTYPVLMAADIIGYDAHYVPVGKDQIQHLEITRDIAETFNKLYGETFVVPQARVDDNVKIVPGTDGQKMSKSYGNTINIFLPEKELKKQIGTIVTDSTPLEEPKNPDTCNVYALYRLIATADQQTQMRNKYLGGNYGYGHAKAELLELILTHFSAERKKFDYLMKNEKELDAILSEGATKAKTVISGVLSKVRGKLGYKTR
jgi:tryptophanyl-tRNA synthetase